MLIKPGDVFIIQLVVVGKIGTKVVKERAESLHKQATKSRGKLGSRENLFLLGRSSRNY